MHLRLLRPRLPAIARLRGGFERQTCAIVTVSSNSRRLGLIGAGLALRGVCQRLVDEVLKKLALASGDFQGVQVTHGSNRSLPQFAAAPIHGRRSTNSQTLTQNGAGGGTALPALRSLSQLVCLLHERFPPFFSDHLVELRHPTHIAHVRRGEARFA